MLDPTEIVKKIKFNKKADGRQVLFDSPDIRITHWSTYLEIECLKERQVMKRDIDMMSILFRKYCESTGNNKLLLFLSGLWRLDPEAWEHISKAGFFGHYIIAFVSRELHQELLLMKLQRFNHNLKVFKNEEQAEEWLVPRYKPA